MESFYTTGWNGLLIEAVRHTATPPAPFLTFSSFSSTLVAMKTTRKKLPSTPPRTRTITVLFEKPSEKMAFLHPNPKEYP